MRKVFMILAFVSLSVASWAQETISDEKHSVATNSFWANWFVQANVAGSSFWGSQENTAVKFGSLVKDYRTNLGFSLALGKWFTPGIGLRTKFSGVWGRSVISEDKGLNANKYWTLQEQVLFNLGNMLLGYNEARVWNLMPYAGFGLGRSMSYDRYGMGFSVGLANTFRVSPKWAVNLDVSYGAYELDFDGCALQNEATHSLKNKDRVISVEVGLTYRLGKSSWQRSAAMDAMSALTQSEIDALNAQLADAQAENDRLMQMLDSQPAPHPSPLTSHPSPLTSPVSVFFELDKSVIASRRELQNVADLVAVARQHNAKLLVTGYADSLTGRADHNRQLSQQRADAVVAEIVKMGLPLEQIEVVAAGGVDTLTPADNNRRVTVEIK